MEEMTLKNNEIKNLQKANKNLESAYKDVVITSKGHEQSVKTLEERILNLQKVVILIDKVAYINNHLWGKLIEYIHSKWSSIQIIYEQRDLLQAALAEIDKTKKEIGNKPTQAIQIIAFLNGKNRQELEELRIPDRTELSFIFEGSLQREIS